MTLLTYFITLHCSDPRCIGSMLLEVKRRSGPGHVTDPAAPNQFSSVHAAFVSMYLDEFILFQSD